MADPPDYLDQATRELTDAMEELKRAMEELRAEPVGGAGYRSARDRQARATERVQELLRRLSETPATATRRAEDNEGA